MGAKRVVCAELRAGVCVCVCVPWEVSAPACEGLEFCLNKGFLAFTSAHNKGVTQCAQNP